MPSLSWDRLRIKQLARAGESEARSQLRNTPVDLATWACCCPDQRRQHLVDGPCPHLGRFVHRVPRGFKSKVTADSPHVPRYRRGVSDRDRRGWHILFAPDYDARPPVF